MNSKFHERFNVEFGAEEARERFVNRIYSLILLDFNLQLGRDTLFALEKALAIGLGRRLDFTPYGNKIREWIGSDFHSCLHAIEIIYKFIDENESYHIRDLQKRISTLFDEAECDIGVRWSHGKFYPNGAQLLDDLLVNYPLKWLRRNQYNSVLHPFEKGLNAYMLSSSHPAVMPNVIIDMYESIEALSKIVTGRKNRDLSANKELMLSKMKVSDSYKQILTDYIDYANQLRHAVEEGGEKPKLSSKEVESFIYLTGVFIRLAMD